MDANVDIQVLEKICQFPERPEVTSFRTEFQRIFVNPDQHYDLHPKDYRNELKAMMLVVSIMMMNVEDMSSNEERELKPIVRALSESVYFSETGQAMAMILFGNAKSDVSCSYVSF